MKTFALVAEEPSKRSLAGSDSMITKGNQSLKEFPKSTKIDENFSLDP
jgi:hypothetical protein